jgi:hypothetical protein
MVLREVIVNNPQATSSALAAPGVGPAHLSEPTRAWHQVSHLGIACQSVLQCFVSAIVEILGKMAGERRTFDELHSR